MNKKLAWVVAPAVLAMSFFAVSNAGATAPKVVSPGMKLVFINPDPSASFCTMGPVGYDEHGKAVGITAGHCIQAPGGWAGHDVTDDQAAMATVYDANDVGFGPIGLMRFWSDDLSFHDFSVIELAPGVVESNQSPAFKVDSIAPGLPAGGSVVSKYGANSQWTYGSVGSTAGGLITSYAYNGRGDSGGPVVTQGTSQWVGITTRMSFVWPPFVSTSAQNILGYLNARNVTGSGFSPLAG